jgi:hypothetical protein
MNSFWLRKQEQGVKHDIITEKFSTIQFPLEVLKRIISLLILLVISDIRIVEGTVTTTGPTYIVVDMAFEDVITLMREFYTDVLFKEE